MSYFCRWNQHETVFLLKGPFQNRLSQVGMYPSGNFVALEDKIVAGDKLGIRRLIYSTIELWGPKAKSKQKLLDRVLNLLGCLVPFGDDRATFQRLASLLLRSLEGFDQPHLVRKMLTSIEGFVARCSDIQSRCVTMVSFEENSWQFGESDFFQIFSVWFLFDRYHRVVRLLHAFAKLLEVCSPITGWSPHPDGDKLLPCVGREAQKSPAVFKEARGRIESESLGDYDKGKFR